MNKPLLVDAKPYLLNEWDYEKNAEIDVNSLTIGSSRKVWWKCSLGHSWETKIANRTRDNKPAGCLVCSNQQVLSGFNDLASRFPEVVELWNFAKNGTVKPNMIMAGSQKKYWWIGVCGHEWQASPDNVTRGRRCPYCGGKKVLKGFNDFASCFPTYLDQWDYDKNDKTPDKVFKSTSTLLYWKCADGHEWRRKPVDQVKIRRCPICPKNTVRRNSFIVEKPELLDEWDYEKNTEASQGLLTSTSKKSVWWICKKKKHSQFMMMKTRAKNGCTLCSKGLAEKRPDLRDEWHFKKNEELGYLFDEMFVNSGVKAWWVCSEKHEYQAVVHSRTRKQKTGCPYCAGLKILKGFNDLATKHPELMKEWDYEKNEKRLLNPSELSCYSTEQVWWKCLNKGHSWATIISARTGKKGSGCPFCSNKQIIPGDNDFATLRKDLLLQWDYIKNSTINIFPEQIAPYSSTKVWWTCDNGHSYYAAPNVKKDECHKCWNGNASRGERKLAEFVEQLVGVDKVVRNDRTVLAPRELDIYIPSLKIAIEYNGVYWHDKKLYLDDLKNNTFHSKEQQKTRDCEILGIYIIHVWEDDWLEDEHSVKEEIIESLTAAKQ